LLSHFDLLDLHAAVKQVVVANILVWNMGLVVTRKLGLSGFDIGLFCKSLTPPLIVFWYGMKVR
jgi:hypothetical protein